MATWSVLNKTGLTYLWGKVKSALAAKQDTLVSGTNIKTVNNTSLLGSGNINIPSGTGTITEVQANGTSVATSGVANIPAATTSAYGVTELSSSTTSTSTTLAATPSAVRTAYHNGAWYATCTTAAATVAKVGTCANFSNAGGLVAGAHVTVKFTNANTAASPTLNVNSTGAKAIYVNGAAATSGAWKAGDVKEFVYDGTNWVMTGGAPNIHYGTSAPANTVGSNGDIFVVYSD